MTDPSPPSSVIPPILPSSEGDDEWQIIDGTPSNVYRSINESESDKNAAIESAAMAAADDNPPPSLDQSSIIDPPSLHQRKHRLSASSSSSSSEPCNDDTKNEETVGCVEVSNEKICRICQDGDNVNDFISPCRCKGSMKYVHSECLEKWRNMSANPKSFFECDQCKYKYHFSRTRAGDILASKWSLHILTFLSMLGLVIVLGYVLKLLNMIPPVNDDDIIVEVNERGDIIIKNTTDIISSPPLSTLSRFYQFIRIDFYHLLYGTVFLGLGGFASLPARGGGLYHFGGGWRSGGSSDRSSSALEMVIIGIIVLIGLVKASFSVYEMVEKRVNKGLLTARQMVINIPEGS